MLLRRNVTYKRCLTNKKDNHFLFKFRRGRFGSQDFTVFSNVQIRSIYGRCKIPFKHSNVVSDFLDPWAFHMESSFSKRWYSNNNQPTVFAVNFGFKKFDLCARKYNKLKWNQDGIQNTHIHLKFPFSYRLQKIFKFLSVGCNARNYFILIWNRRHDLTRGK